MKISDLILYNNNQLIAFNKPAGIPLQEDKTKDKSIHQLAEIYCKHPVQLIHRIDRPASGIVLMAKNKKAAMALSKQFSERKVNKTYLAVVGKDRKLDKEGTLEDLIFHNKKKNKSYVVEHKDDGAKEATLSYKQVAEIENYQLFQIELHTGRHHQIRCQLGNINLPIKGDVKYGARRSNKDRSIHLHAWKLSFRHPISSEQVDLVAEVPKDPVWEAFQDINPNLKLFFSRSYIDL